MSSTPSQSRSGGPSCSFSEADGVPVSATLLMVSRTCQPSVSKHSVVLRDVDWCGRVATAAGIVSHAMLGRFRLLHGVAGTLSVVAAPVNQSDLRMLLLQLVSAGGEECMS